MITTKNNIVLIQHPRTMRWVTVGRVVGEAFVKTITKSNQMLRKPLGYCLDAEVFEWILRQENIKEIKIKQLDKTVLYASIDKWKEKHDPRDLGYGKQVCLYLNYWLSL